MSTVQQVSAPRGFAGIAVKLFDKQFNPHQWLELIARLDRRFDFFYIHFQRIENNITAKRTFCEIFRDGLTEQGVFALYHSTAIQMGRQDLADFLKNELEAIPEDQQLPADERALATDLFRRCFIDAFANFTPVINDEFLGNAATLSHENVSLNQMDPSLSLGMDASMGDTAGIESNGFENYTIIGPLAEQGAMSRVVKATRRGDENGQVLVIKIPNSISNQRQQVWMTREVKLAKLKKNNKKKLKIDIELYSFSAPHSSTPQP